jgi:Rieske Fe-S protein
MMSEETYTRRNFVKKSTKFIAAAILFPLFITRNKKAEAKNSNAKADGSLDISLDLKKKKYAALKEIGGSVYLDIKGENKPAIVHRISETEVVAFSSECTHVGCKVNLPTSDGKVICPCHGSLFDEKGKLVHGPATRDLKSFSAKLEGSTITITSG